MNGNRKSTVAIAVIAIVVLSVFGCATQPVCETPEWSPGDPVNAQDSVMWSATVWALSPDSPNTSAYAPCGGMLRCADVAEYVRDLNGKVYSESPYGCGVFWLPDTYTTQETGETGETGEKR